MTAPVTFRTFQAFGFDAERAIFARGLKALWYHERHGFASSDLEDLPARSWREVSDAEARGIAEARP